MPAAAAAAAQAAIQKGDDYPFGAMTFFAQGWDSDLMPLLAKAGIYAIRDEQHWADVEPKPGTFTFPARLQGYMDDARKAGLSPLVVMAFGNPAYDHGDAPASDDGRNGYARYGEELLKHYGDQIHALEIWNEYNGSWCGGEAEQDRPKYYADMLKVAYQRIKALRPDVKVGGCAAAVIPQPYLEGIFRNGGLDAMDAVVVHPYREQPEGVETEIADLETLIRQYNDGKDKPIWATETGCLPEADEYPWEQGSGLFEKSRAHVARYLARQYALLLSTGAVTRISWFVARDYREFLRMGLIRDADADAGRNDVAAPYVAYATLIRHLGGMHPTGRAALGKFTYVLAFANGTDQMRVCWATAPAHIALDCAGPVTVTDLMGADEVLTPVHGQVWLTLTEDPVYVRGAVTGVHEGGDFALAASQSVDLLGDYAIDWTSADPAFAATMEIAGVAHPLAGRAGRVVIAGADTTQVRADTVHYRLLVDGKPAGLGGVALRVVDPLAMPAAPLLLADGRVRLRIVNTSSRQDYQVTGVDLALTDPAGHGPAALAGQQAVTATLAHGTATTIDLPLAGVAPYRRYDLATNLRCAGRAALHQLDAVSWNPCPTRTLAADGPVAEWQQGTAIDLAADGAGPLGATPGTLHGSAWIAADDKNIYLAAKLPFTARLRVAVAPDYPGTWAARAATDADLTAWYGFNVDGDGNLALECGPAGTAVRPGATATPLDDGVLHRITIPWSQLPPLDPAAGAFRLALVANDGRGTSAWGTGILLGASPDGFRVCQRLGATGTTAATGIVVHVAPLPAATVFSHARTLADLHTDYSKVQGRNGWSYGFYAGAAETRTGSLEPSGPYTDNDFVAMTNVQTAWGYAWKGIAQYNEQGPTNAHPGILDGNPVWAVRRWTAGEDGVVRITGSFAHDREGDGIGGRVLIDGVQVYATLVGGPVYPARADYIVTVPVAKGTLVDFAVTPGPGMDTSFDSATLTAQIDLLTP